MPAPRLADPFYSVVDPSPFYRRRGKGYHGTGPSMCCARAGEEWGASPGRGVGTRACRPHQPASAALIDRP